MIASIDKHRIIAAVVNGIAIFLMLLRMYQIDSDKGIIIFIFYYPILLVINFLVFLILFFTKNKLAKVYVQIVLALLFLLVPLAILASNL